MCFIRLTLYSYTGAARSELHVNKLFSEFKIYLDNVALLAKYIYGKLVSRTPVCCRQRGYCHLYREYKISLTGDQITTIISRTFLMVRVRFLASEGSGGLLTNPPSRLRLRLPRLVGPWYCGTMVTGSRTPQLKTTLAVFACRIGNVRDHM